MLCERVTSGVETDKQKPGYHSATGEDEIAPLYITTKRVHCLKVMEQGCYIQCFVYVCLTSQDYCKTEAMLNSNNNCNGKVDKINAYCQGTYMHSFYGS